MGYSINFADLQAGRVSRGGFEPNLPGRDSTTMPGNLFQGGRVVVPKPLRRQAGSSLLRNFHVPEFPISIREKRGIGRLARAYRIMIFALSSHKTTAGDHRLYALSLVDAPLKFGPRLEEAEG